MKFLPILLVFASTAFCLEYNHESSSGYTACAQLHQAINGSTKETQITPYCDFTNQPFLGSMSVCLIENLNNRRYTFAFLEFCESQGIVLNYKDLDSSYKNATSFLVDSSSEKAKTSWLNAPISFTSKEVSKTRKSVQDGNETKNYDLTFSIVLLSYWFFVCFIATVINWSRRLFPKTLTSFIHCTPMNWVRAHFILPPFLRRTHFDVARIGPLEWLTPLRLEATLLLVYFVLCAIFCGVKIKPLSSFPIAASIGNRSGLIAIFSLPVLILFAGRNNFLQFATGWQFTRFITLHRWIARVVFLLVLVHSATKTHGMLYLKSYTMMMKQPFMIWGAIGTVSAGFLLFFSMIWFRRRNYEVFLLIHYIFAGLMIAGGWIHVKILGLQEFFIASLAIWAFNMVVRCCRIFAFGLQNASVELKADETLRVVVERPSWWKPHPGAHAFVHFVFAQGFWQSHPFTVIDEPVSENTMGFYIKIKGGITSSLYQKVRNAPNQKLEMKVAIEGPYFEKMPIETMENLVFIASGNGIPGMYAEARHVAIRHSHIPSRLIWSIRDYSSICWFHQELKKLEALNIETTIYISRPGDSTDLAFSIEHIPNYNEKIDMASLKTTSTLISLVKALKEDLLFIKFVEGRPNVSSLVSNSVVAAGDRSVGFVTCGHPKMVDEVRAQVVTELSKDTSRKIELFEEFQMW